MLPPDPEVLEEEELVTEVLESDELAVELASELLELLLSEELDALELTSELDASSSLPFGTLGLLLHALRNTDKSAKVVVRNTGIPLLEGLSCP